MGRHSLIKFSNVTLLLFDRHQQAPRDVAAGEEGTANNAVVVQAPEETKNIVCLDLVQKMAACLFSLMSHPYSVTALLLFTTFASRIYNRASYSTLMIIYPAAGIACCSSRLTLVMLS